ncbi:MULTISPECIES: S26 family signal peptidase [unclassified Undibacterium]|uniref:S26 family signal peptidase n=1 Tax=unclassified Undibacterium TaxID=2630295 RepID=UPI002AC92B50|nr:MULTISPECIES: S26 family signal peptidase [unclassified Undibacterium]MEB0139444.1 S26 family signal peptidase [Undibacterium sp. CCC2.1]MEB0171674.1 S26 family signal peptidase [Undibacterium sp. CCC1.1]MEB0176188.1 S26 family signal peptidase [Undibacterium sp. CCC3.4]MEB0215019.1 S26 family signal peptidase [Undibacterium sp. 5I2]WPX43200.1 S26 family signal peptidase [Undibacterium sp. CCC3.4]
MNGRRAVVALLTSLGIAALAWPSLHTSLARIVYNPSDSVPPGWYRIDPPESLHVGSFVLVQLPADTAALAAQRGYLPEHIPLLKRIGAMSPQQVCIEKRIVRIDDIPVAGVHATDGRGRPLSAWQQCRQLHGGELFLLSATNPASFDSRYFGPVAVSAVIGSAQPLWTW